MNGEDIELFERITEWRAARQQNSQEVLVDVLKFEGTAR